MTPVLLCLHGWGGDKTSFTELREALNQSLRSDSGQALKNDDITILTPDLPGFGDEPEPKEAWTVDDYAEWVESWLQNNSQFSILNSSLLVLGHSHGGRIAIKLAVRGNIDIAHLYLCAAAGIRRPRHFKRIIGLTLAKAGKALLSIPGLKQLQPVAKKLLYRLVRVHDYEKASPVMRDTLIKVTQEDLRPLLPLIHVPTDIFWGKDDQMTPVKDAMVIHRAIKDSRLNIYDGVRHRVHRDKATEIAAVIRQDIG